LCHFSIDEIAHLIKEVVGYAGELVFNTDKPDGTMKKVLDVSKMKELGWEPQSAYERLEEVIHWTLKNDRWLII
jgi:GDP-L-fucose synthase